MCEEVTGIAGSTRQESVGWISWEEGVWGLGVLVGGAFGVLG